MLADDSISFPCSSLSGIGTSSITKPYLFFNTSENATVSGNSKNLFVNVLVIEIQESFDECIGIGSFLEHLVDKLFIFGDL